MAPSAPVPAAADPDLAELGHYVVTSHPPGAVQCSAKCAFTAADAVEVAIAKSNRIEVRRFRGASASGGGLSGENTGGGAFGAPAIGGSNDDPFPVVLTLPVNGRIVNLAPIRFPNSKRDCLFFFTEKGGYALISYDESLADAGSSNGTSDVSTAAPVTGEHYPVRTHATGSLKSYTASVLAGGRMSECGPLLAVDPLFRCLALHVYDGYLTIIPINRGYNLEGQKRVPWRRNASDGRGAQGTLPGIAEGVPRASDAQSLAGGSGKPAAKPRGLSTGPFGEAFNLRIEERTVLSLGFLKPAGTKSAYVPQAAVLHQDARGFQHVRSHGVDLGRKALIPNGHLSATNPTAGASRKGSMDGEGLKPSATLMPPPGEQLKISKIEGGSGCLIPIPPPPKAGDASAKRLGGVLVLGQRQITYHSSAEATTRVRPTGGALLLAYCPVDGPSGDENVVRYLLGDERGRLHLLSLVREKGLVTTLHLATLGVASAASSLGYLGGGAVFLGSQFGDSQLLRILDEPVPTGTFGGGTEAGGAADDSPLADTTLLEVLAEHPNLGPVVDFDLRPCGDAPSTAGGKHRQSAVATCSGVARDGSVRLVTNGVGLRERAAVAMGGITGMWPLRAKFDDVDDAYLVQGFVGETRILGVQARGEEGMDEDGMDEEGEGGALAEVTIPGFDAAKSTLFAGNVRADGSDLLVQAVADGVRLVDAATLSLVARWSPFDAGDDGSDDDAPAGFVTVAAGNEGGQIVVALRGGAVVHLVVEGGAKPRIRTVKRVTLEREISCLDLNPFAEPSPAPKDGSAMDVDDGGHEGETDASRAPAKSPLVAVGLWDDFSVRLLRLGDDPSSALEQVLRINLGRGGARTSEVANDSDDDEPMGEGGQHMMARSLCLVTLDAQSAGGVPVVGKGASSSAARTGRGVDMLLVGLGDGTLLSFAVDRPASGNGWSVHSRKEVGLGTQGIHLVPFRHGAALDAASGGGACVLATGDRPTVVYLAGGASNANPKLNYSSVSLASDDDDDDEEVDDEGRASTRNLSVNVAAPFRSSLLFSHSHGSSSLCVADEATLRLGVIDGIQRLHVTTHRLGMTPRRICHHAAGRVYAVGCIGADVAAGGEANGGNCVRFFDDATFEELRRINLEPFEMILSVESVSLSINAPPRDGRAAPSSTDAPVEYRPFVVLGTAFAYPDEDEPSKGRVIVVECNSGATGGLKDDSDDQLLRQVRQVADLVSRGGIFSIAPFYEGNVLVTCGSKTMLCQLSESIAVKGDLLLNQVGSGHHGHIVSLMVKSLASNDGSLQKSQEKKQHAIVGDLMRSISLVVWYPKHQVIEELARDYNANYCTDIAMLSSNVYLGSEGHNNLFVLRYNPNATTEQARVRLDNAGQYHLGEMVNKLMGGSLVMPSSSSAGSGSGASADGKMAATEKSSRKIDITIGSQTLYGTVDGSIGTILGLGGKTLAFLSALQRAMDAIVRPVGDLSRGHYRAWEQDQRRREACGFVDGDWIETFLDLGGPTMAMVVAEMNRDKRWRIRDEGRGFEAGSEDRQNMMDADDQGTASTAGASELTVEDVLGAVEELSMMH